MKISWKIFSHLASCRGGCNNDVSIYTLHRSGSGSAMFAHKDLKLRGGTQTWWRATAQHQQLLIKPNYSEGSTPNSKDTKWSDRREHSGSCLSDCERNHNAMFCRVGAATISAGPPTQQEPTVKVAREINTKAVEIKAG